MNLLFMYLFLFIYFYLFCLALCVSCPFFHFHVMCSDLCKIKYVCKLSFLLYFLLENGINLN